MTNKTKAPTFEKEMKKIKEARESNADEYKEAVIKMTELMTNLIGAQRETLTLLSSLGKMMLRISSQLNTMATINFKKDQFNKPTR